MSTLVAEADQALRDAAVIAVRTLEEHRQWWARFGDPYEPTPNDLPESI